MIADYYYNDGYVVTDLLNDIVAMLTGETVVANLSPACNQATTIIKSVVPAGWTLHDNAVPVVSGRNIQVLRSLVAGETTLYKYLIVEIEDASDEDLFFYTCESWDNALHTGTNVMNINIVRSKLSDSLVTSPVNSGRLMLAANSGMAFFRPRWGTEITAQMVFEFTPMMPWHAVGDGGPYTPWCSAERTTTGIQPNGSYINADFFGIPRMKDMQNIDIVSGTAIIGRIGVGGARWAAYNINTSALTTHLTTSALMPDAVGGSAFALMPMYLHDYNNIGGVLGNISDAANVWWMNDAVTNDFSLFVVDGQDFISTSIGTTYDGVGSGVSSIRLAIPNE